MKINQYPKLWNWNSLPAPRRLSEWAFAPDTSGFYELGEMSNGAFQAKYCGRATHQTLRERLRQHSKHSHNPEIRSHVNGVWYRCKSFESVEVASYVEAVHIVAMEYEWNKRNEWRMHWALET